MMPKYKTIYVDPPWNYNSRTWDGGSSKAAVSGHIKRIPYAQMSLADIKALPVASLADDNCELYLWATQKYLPSAYDVLGAWGFKYCQTLTWCKAPMGTGQGGMYCPTTEFLILGRRGRMPNRVRIDSTWWQVKRQRKHSQKPDFFRQMIEDCSDSPRLEMFARDKVRGWDVWGNEAPSPIDLAI